MHRRRIAALDAQHRASVLTSVVDSVEDTVTRLTMRGLVELDDYERKVLVKDLTVAFCAGRGRNGPVDWYGHVQLAGHTSRTWSRPTCTAHRTSPTFSRSGSMRTRTKLSAVRGGTGHDRSPRALLRRRQRPRLHRPPHQPAEALPERHRDQLRLHPVGAAERRGPEGLPGLRSGRRADMQRRARPLQPAQRTADAVRRRLARHQGDGRSELHVPLAVHGHARHDATSSTTSPSRAGTRTTTWPGPTSTSPRSSRCRTTGSGRRPRSPTAAGCRPG